MLHSLRRTRCSAVCDSAFFLALEKTTGGNAELENIEQANFEGRKKTKERSFQFRWRKDEDFPTNKTAP